MALSLKQSIILKNNNPNFKVLRNSKKRVYVGIDQTGAVNRKVKPAHLYRLRFRFGHSATNVYFFFEPR